MKKILACVLAFMILVTPVKASALEWPWKSSKAATAETVVAETESPDAEVAEGEEEAGESETLPEPEYNYEELVVGTTMPMYGTFFTSMWGNGSSDIDVRLLLHDYNLVEWDTGNGGFMLNPTVVSDNRTTQNAAGDHVYTITLKNNLQWSDGSPITAWDYAFSMLLRMDPEIEKLDGTPREMEYLSGYEKYVKDRVQYLEDIERDRQQNRTNVDRDIPFLPGVHVVNNTHITITISHEVLPFFFELGLLDCSPYPIQVIAPECEIKDDGDGVYVEGDFNAEVLKETLLGEDGYIAKPTVTSGPYRLESYDGTEAKFTRNEYYKGDAYGSVPEIERIIFRTADPETMIQELMDGEYGLLTRVGGAEQIQDAMQALAERPEYATQNYPRSGLSFISFNRDNTIFDSEDLRKAIAHCIDKEVLAGEAVSNFGLRVDGYYGLGQWMVQLLNGTLGFPVEEPDTTATAAEKQAYEKELARWEALTGRMEELPVYETDIEEAVRLLVKDGWTLNLDGKVYNPDEDEVRCKSIDGEIVPLELKLVYAKGIAAAEELENLSEVLAPVGIRLTVEGIDGLLDQYYRHTEREYDLAFLATNFNILFDPSLQFEPDGAFNYFGSDDEKLYDLAQDMIKTEAGDLVDYCEKWMAFQERFVEVEPLIPIYSNIYFDFYLRTLHDYQVTNYTSWAQAVVPAYLDEIEEEEVAEEAEEDIFPD